MNRSLIMKIEAVISAVFGLALLFAPNALVAMYKAEPMNGPGIYNSMLYGAALIALALMNWQTSGANATEAKHVILGTLVANSLGFLVGLTRQLTDPSVPATAWFNVVLFLVFAILYGYLQFARAPAGSPAAGSAA
jgi:hypothetical protein